MWVMTITTTYNNKDATTYQLGNTSSHIDTEVIPYSVQFVLGWETRVQKLSCQPQRHNGPTPVNSMNRFLLIVHCHALFVLLQVDFPHAKRIAFWANGVSGVLALTPVVRTEHKSDLGKWFTKRSQTVASAVPKWSGGSVCSQSVTSRRMKDENMFKWSACSNACGEYGTQERLREVIHQAKPDGRKCGPKVEWRFCLLSECH